MATTSRGDTGTATKEDILTQLQNLQNAIEKENVSTIRDLLNALNQLFCYSKVAFEELCQNSRCITQTDFVINACIHKKPDVLHVILYETDFMDYLHDPNVTVQQEDDKRLLAFRYAIYSDNFDIVNMLYDYWCGNVWTDSDINNVYRLGNLLENIRVKYKEKLIEKQAMKHNIECLVAYNKFQRELKKNYIVLHLKSLKLHNTDDKAEENVATLLKVLEIFDNYSNIDAVRVPHQLHEREQLNKAKLEQNVGTFRYLCYIMYEQYFRKLDFTVTIIIMEMLNLLRHHLRKLYHVNKEDVETYEQVENKMYHFIYRSTEDWRLYLPSNRQETIKRNRIGYHEGKIYKNLELKYDESKIENAPVIYLEREEFIKCLQKLKEILNKCVTSRCSQGNNNKHGTAVTLLDDNYLKNKKYLRDHYSLKKVVYYLKAVEQCDNKPSVLLIERALQVVGEMLKTTKESCHLSPTIKALIQNELGIQIITNLYGIRDYLSHVDKGQLTSRIQFVNNPDSIHILNSIRKDLKEIVKGLDPILEINKLLLDKSLLENGLNILDARIKFLEQVDSETKASKDYEKEIDLTQSNRESLSIKKDNASRRVISIAEKILPKYIKSLKHTLDIIKCNNEKWDDVKNKLLPIYQKKIPDYPSSEHISNLLNKIEKLAKRNKTIDIKDIKCDINQIQDLSTHWDYAKNLLDFFANEMEYTLFEIQDIRNMSPDNQTIVSMIDKLSQVQTNWCLNMSISRNNHSYNGIEKMKQRTYLIDNDKKSRKMKKEQLLLCLLDRIDKLKHVLDYPKQMSLKHLMLKHKRDQVFQLELEMLLVDIGNILAFCNARLMNKSKKLLTGINLGNVLDHGNPFLEVIGDVLDYHDFATELVSKAMMFAQDGDGITALYKLFKGNVSFNSIEGNDQSKMTDEQKQYHNQFKMLESRCKEYLKLIPK